MVELSSVIDRLSTTTRSLNPSSDFIMSSDNKKIGRSFFKNDVIVKSYKCNLSGPSICVPTKMYVSSISIYLVHRPKRTKVTVIPFTAVRDIQSRDDALTVDIHLANGVVYTVSKFDRPIPAVTFLVNFWSLISKEKVWLDQRSNGPPTEMTNSIVDRCSADSGLPTTNHNTTNTSFHSNTNRTRLSMSSLNSASGGTTSEADSMYSHTSGRSTNSFKSPPPTLNSNQSTTSTSAVRHLSRSRTICDKRNGHSNSPTISRRVSDVVQSSMPTTRIIVPDVVAIPSTHNFPSSTAAAAARKQQTGPPFSPSPGDTSFPFKPARPPLPSYRPRVSSNSATRRSEFPSPGWSLWPLNFLPYPFTAPPQRLTVIIAYAILVFLLFSTMHLYHRLAVFDLTDDEQTSPFDHCTSTRNKDSHPHQSTTLLYNWQLLETHLTHLVSLTAKMTQTLVHLSEAFHAINDHSSSPATCSTEAP